MTKIQELTLKLDLARYVLINVGTEKMNFKCFMDGKKYPINKKGYIFYISEIIIDISSFKNHSFKEAIKLICDQYLRELNHEEEKEKNK